MLEKKNRLTITLVSALLNFYKLEVEYDASKIEIRVILPQKGNL